MDPIKKHVSSLSIYQIEKIIADWEQYEKDGTIGDVDLRIHARELMKNCGATTMITTWMNLLAFECYRYLASFYKSEYNELLLK